MRAMLEEAIWAYLNTYCHSHGWENVWEPPVVRFAAADDPGFAALQTLVVPDHHLPGDFLPSAATVISYYLPFVPAVGRSNGDSGPCSAQWAEAYLHTNAMAAELNVHLTALLERQGHPTAIPQNAGINSIQVLKSRWSQRHVAYLAGQGTFGLNNMLISDRGSVGRYFSLVTAAVVPPDPVVTEERCLYKRNGSCRLCVRRCPAHALTPEGFDRRACYAQCMENDRRFPGADVCGKCVVDLPCSYRPLKDPLNQSARGE